MKYGVRPALTSKWRRYRAYILAAALVAMVYEYGSDTKSARNAAPIAATKTSPIASRITTETAPEAANGTHLSALDGVPTEGSDPFTTYTVSGGIDGLVGQGLVLTNGASTVTPSPDDPSFTFPDPEAAGAAYNVTVQIQPTGSLCSVLNGTGVVGTGDVTDVQVTCTATLFSLGGTIRGLTSPGLVLSNGLESVDPPAGATTFTFQKKFPTATSFDVTVATQPFGETCQVTNGIGVILTSGVSDVDVSCH